MQKKSSHCACCHRKFVPDRYNRHSQKYCTDPRCVAERGRKRKRAYYRRRYADDPQFQSRERDRCRAKAQERKARSPPPPPVPPPPPPSPNDVLMGLVSQLMDSDDPAEVASLVSRYGDRGRRLAVPAPSGNAPPGMIS